MTLITRIYWSLLLSLFCNINCFYCCAYFASGYHCCVWRRERRRMRREKSRTWQKKFRMRNIVFRTIRAIIQLIYYSSLGFFCYILITVVPVLFRIGKIRVVTGDWGWNERKKWIGGRVSFLLSVSNSRKLHEK